MPQGIDRVEGLEGSVPWVVAGVEGLGGCIPWFIGSVSHRLCKLPRLCSAALDSRSLHEMEHPESLLMW